VANGGGAGPRWLEVGPDRIEGWLADFSARHGPAVTTTDARRSVVTVRGATGTVAECHVPFPPLPPVSDDAGAELAAHAAADRTVGVLLVRLGGYAAGVFSGAPPRLAASKVGSRLVHGRSAAGGQSQQRFARRREKQAHEALAAAADCAAAVFGPYAGRLDAVVLGGDKRAIAPLLAVLRGTPRGFTAVRIRLTEPAANPPL
jgi:hypothetical protein